MKKLDHYVTRELLVPFLIGTLAVVLMFQANLLIFQLKTFSLTAIPVAATLQLILYKTPQFLNMTLPVGMSLAGSLAMSRLVRESELTAFRVAGARILRVVAPIMAFGVLVGLLNYIVAEKVMPPAEARWRQLATQAALLGAAPDFKSNVVVNLRHYTASFGAVQRVDASTVRLSNILLIERPSATELVLYTAESGEYRDGVWRLRGPFVRRLQGLSLFLAKPGKDIVINEPITVESIFTQPLDEEKSAEQLARQIREGKRAGFDTTATEVKLHARYSVPAACVVFALVAPLCAIWFSRSGGFVGVLLSIVLVFLYYNAYIISTEILGRHAIVAPVVSAWLPNALFLSIGLLALRRLE